MGYDRHCDAAESLILALAIPVEAHRCEETQEWEPLTEPLRSGLTWA